MLCGCPPSLLKGRHFIAFRHQSYKPNLSLHRPNFSTFQAFFTRDSGFYGFCELCGTGDGIVTCPRCQGLGKVATKPGGAGVRFLVGSAKCKLCSGQGRVACVLCTGYEVPLPPPQPFRQADGSFEDEELNDEMTGPS